MNQPEQICRLGGVWSQPSSRYPELEDVMFIDEGRQRILSFVMNEHKGRPVRYSIRHWYQRVSVDRIRTGLRSSYDWAIHDFRLRDNQLVFLSFDWNARRLAPDEYPEWLDEEIRKAHMKMDELEVKG